ncbi:type 2 periplasmic-binding domain-containing protein [Herbidospora sp. RD11066]
MASRRLTTLAGALVLLLAGCGQEVVSAPSPSVSPSSSPSATRSPSASPSPTPTPSGTGEGALTVLAPRGFVEWGGNDRKVNWVAPFERATGCRVTYRPWDYVAGNPVNVDTFDVVAAGPDLAGKLVAEQGAARVDTGEVAGYSSLPKWVRELVGDHGVPYVWDTTVVAVKDGAKGSIFETDEPVLLRDSPLTIADAALALGFDNPYQLSPEQLGEAVALLEKKKEGRAYWRDPIQVIEGFAGGAAMAQATPYVLGGMAGAGLKVRQAEGPATGWVMSWMVSARAAHPECAKSWLDYSLRPEVQREVAWWTGTAPANTKACTYKTPEKEALPDEGVKQDRIATLCGEHLSKGVVFATFPAKDCGGEEGSCTAYEDWIKAWGALKEQ